MTRVTGTGLRSVVTAIFASLLLASCGGDCLQIGGCDRGGAASTATGTGSKSNSSSNASGSGGSYCGRAVGPNSITGTVLRVSDGDTITVSSNGQEESIRLEGIDAPESDQAFGAESKTALSALVLNKTVTVTYTERDQYDRIIGGVFTGSCDYVNLTQVETGMAWFYAAYQCDLPSATREQFKAAQDAAIQSGIGLWSQSNPVAPWVFRNGVDPDVPQCAADTGTNTPATSNPVNEALGISCGSKTTCSQMTSCAEATTYLNQCSIRSLDADGDGIPCESICR